MGKQAKPGQIVRHRGTRQSGTITSVVQGIARVVWADGSESKMYAGSLHPARGGPCLVIALILLAVPTLAAGAAFYVW